MKKLGTLSQTHRLDPTSLFPSSLSVYNFLHQSQGLQIFQPHGCNGMIAESLSGPRPTCRMKTELDWDDCSGNVTGQDPLLFSMPTTHTKTTTPHPLTRDHPPPVYHAPRPPRTAVQDPAPFARWCTTSTTGSKNSHTTKHLQRAPPRTCLTTNRHGAGSRWY